MPAGALNDQLEAVRADMEAATDALFTSIETIRKALGAVIPEAVEAELTRMIEALSFQDIAGQRLSIIADLASGAAAPQGGPQSLENGPALNGAGLGQADADSYFALAKK